MSLLFFVKSFALFIFAQGIIPSALRSLAVFGVTFFVLPRFFPALEPLITKIQLLSVGIVLFEFIAYRGQSALIGQEKPASTVKKALSKAVDTKLKLLLNKKHLSLFLHTNRINIYDLVPRSIYLGLDIDESYGEGIKIFDHYEKPIVGVEIETCRHVLKSLAAYPELERIFSAIKSSSSSALSLAIHVNEITKARKDFLLAMQSCTNIIGAYFDCRWNINLVIDGMQCITGFSSFAHLAENTNSGLLTISLPVNIRDESMLLEVFEQKFWEFSEALDRTIMNTNFENSFDAQLCLTFAQQMQYLKEPIKDLLAIVLRLAKSSNLSYKNNIFFEIHFLNSVPTFKEEGDIVPKEIQSCTVQGDAN